MKNTKNTFNAQRKIRNKKALLMHNFCKKTGLIFDICLFGRSQFFSWQILKLYAWEPSFQKIVGGIRKKEIDILKQMGYLSVGTSFLWQCAPFFVSLVSYFFLVFGPLLWGDTFSDHLLWSIFQSSLNIYYTLQIMLNLLCGQVCSDPCKS